METKCISNKNGTPQFLNLTIGKVYKTKEVYCHFNDRILVKDDSGKWIEYSKSLFEEV